MENNAPIKVTITSSCDGDYLRISTYSRQFKRQGSFYVDKNRLAEWLMDEHAGTYFDRDGNNCLSVRKNREDGLLVFDLLWVGCAVYGRVSGIVQTLYVSRERVEEAINAGTRIVALSRRPNVKGKLDCTRCAKTIQRIRANKKALHAFRKVLRDRFVGDTDKTVLYPDGCLDFFFRNECYCGGVIFGCCGGKAQYGIHT